MIAACHQTRQKMTRQGPLAPAEQKKTPILRGKDCSRTALPRKCCQFALKAEHNLKLFNIFDDNAQKSSGRPEKVAEIELILIHRILARELISLRGVIVQLGLNIYRITLWPDLRRGNKFRYMKMLKTLDRTTTHKQKKIEFSVLNVGWDLEWSVVIWSDEKMCKLDGTDG